MAEDSDYNPGQWAGHDFKSARAHYDQYAGRSYAAATAKGVVASSLVPEKLTTQSTSPLVVMVDVTGSMGTWPGVIFSKLPYLDIEGKTYLGPDMEISFAAAGDLFDKYPLQARPFGAGIGLKDHLVGNDALIIEKGGSGPDSGCEAYEVGALYYAHNVEMPNAVKPVFIFVADEQPHATITTATARDCAKVATKKMLSVDEVFAALKRKYSVYLVHKAYSPAARAEWVRLLGEDHIADLQEPDRVVDIIFGILARETDQVGYFRKEIEGRQTPRQVDTAYKALKTIHTAAGVPAAGKSTLHKPTGGSKSKDLL